MRKIEIHRRARFGALVVLGALLLALVALRPGLAQQDPNAPMKNIKLLTGKTRPEVILIMKSFCQALGVKCKHCHVKDFSSDEKDEKKKARQMIEMLASINQSTLENKGTCWMCHRGQKEGDYKAPPLPGPAPSR